MEEGGSVCVVANIGTTRYRTIQLGELSLPSPFGLDGRADVLRTTGASIPSPFNRRPLKQYGQL